MSAENHSGTIPDKASEVEAWPGRNADLMRRRVVTLGKLGLMLSVMASGNAADLYGEVLMALGIEDADDTDIALEIARDHPEGDTLAATPASEDAIPAGEPVEREEYDRNRLAASPKPQPSPGSEREAMVKLVAFALKCSAGNPANIGPARNEAVELLEGLGIEPRETGLFYRTREAELSAARQAILALRPPVTEGGE